MVDGQKYIFFLLLCWCQLVEKLLFFALFHFLSLAVKVCIYTTNLIRYLLPLYFNIYDDDVIANITKKIIKHLQISKSNLLAPQLVIKLDSKRHFIQKATSCYWSFVVRILSSALCY